MNNPDQDTLVRAIEDARRILGEYKSSLATIMTSPWQQVIHQPLELAAIIGRR